MDRLLELNMLAYEPKTYHHPSGYANRHGRRLYWSEVRGRYRIVPLRPGVAWGLYSNDTQALRYLVWVVR